MTREDIDAFFAATDKTLPAAPEWRELTSRLHERRASLPVYVGGVRSPLQVNLVAFVNEPAYLTINLLASRCVARLCLSGSHWDRRAGKLIDGPHWHSWDDNRPTRAGLPATLGHAIAVPDLTTRDAAFAWFLGEVGIENPRWPMAWPSGETLL